MRRSFNLLGRALGAALMFGATAAQAQVVGTFNAAGSASYGGNASAVQINPGSPPNIIALQTLDGIFGALASNTLGTMQGVTVGTGPMSIANFIQVGGYTFSLTSIAPTSYSSAQCAAPAAAGQVCGNVGSGFNWSNVSNGVGGLNSSAAFNFMGVVTTPTAQTYNYTGIYTGQFVGRSYQQIIGSLAGGAAAPKVDSYSLNIQAVSSVPEPATVALMATGLVALGGIARRRRNTV